MATPEEIVRQLWIAYFLEVLKVNSKMIAAERAFELHGLKKRFDLVIFRKDTTPLLLAEFKAPDVTISQAVFDQVALYNMKWEVPYALISNGREHFCFRIDSASKSYLFESKLPL